MLVCLLTIIKSKENTNYTMYRLKVFLIGIFIIILSELSLRFIEKDLFNNLLILSIPILMIICLFIIFYFKLKFKENQR